MEVGTKVKIVATATISEVLKDAVGEDYYRVQFVRRGLIPGIRSISIDPSEVGEALEETSTEVKVLGCAMFPVMLVLKTVTLDYLWKWFISPFGLPAISMLHAFGIIITIALLTSAFKVPKKDQVQTVPDEVGPALAILFGLLLGYVAHRLM